MTDKTWIEDIFDRGTWINDKTEIHSGIYWYCSRCGYYPKEQYVCSKPWLPPRLYFCPNCGYGGVKNEKFFIEEDDENSVMDVDITDMRIILNNENNPFFVICKKIQEEFNKYNLKVLTSQTVPMNCIVVVGKIDGKEQYRIINLTNNKAIKENENEQDDIKAKACIQETVKE